MSAPSRAPSPAAAALLLLAACAKPIALDVRSGDPLAVQALAVFPFGFRWDEPAYRSYELAELMALRAVETNRYAVFGPGEFRLVRATADNPFVGTDLAIGLADRGLSPLKAVVFRPSAERRTNSAVKQVFDAAGRPKGTARVEETTLVAKLEVFHSASREIIAELSGTAEVDVFAARDPADPLPELTRLLEEMTVRALAAIASRAPGELVLRDPGFDYAWNPKAALEYAADGRPPLAESLGKADLLEQDVLVESRLRFFHPNADLPTLMALKRLPAGLYVRNVGAAAACGLAAGDLIVGIDGEPALPQALHRALRAADVGKTIPIKIRRSSGMADLALPVAAPRPSVEP